MGNRGGSKRRTQKLLNIDSSFKYDKGEIHTKSSQTVTFGGIIQEDSRIEGEE